MNRRTAIRAIGGAGLGALAGCAGAASDIAPETDTPVFEGRPTLASPAFEDGEEIPQRHTCDGEESSPPLSISETPPGVESFALLVDDPDAPEEPFTHWILFDIPPETTEIPEGVPATETVEELGGAKQGTNDRETLGYAGPCPPEGDGPHTYRFQLFALERPLHLLPEADREALAVALEKVDGVRVDLEGTYER